MYFQLFDYSYTLPYGYAFTVEILVLEIALYKSRATFGPRFHLVFRNELPTLGRGDF